LLIRRVKEEDLDYLASMFSRMYSLNAEFDPMLQVPEDLEQRVKQSLLEDMKNPDSMIVVAEDEGKVVGGARVKVQRRRFYVPERVAIIEEIYVMPAFRRMGVGNAILNYVSDELRKAGISSMTARFPAKNIIAVSFYRKRDFREIHHEFIKRIE
jgi:GNAT superfamily N-acetyltransferase